MSSIDRSYCIVKVEKESGRFLSVEAIKPTYDEAIDYINNLTFTPETWFVIWGVINE